MNVNRRPAAAVAALSLALAAAHASSHREAPFITTLPKVDATDFYIFRSYEPGREDFMTAIANYLPLQDPAGEPSYYTLQDHGRYDIHIDSDGDAAADYTFTFEMVTQYSPHLIQTDDGSFVELPLIYNPPGPITALLDSNLGVLESYILTATTPTGTYQAVNTTLGSSVFYKPIDHVGTNLIPDYETYAAQHVFDFDFPLVPGLAGRVFVGSRKDPFVANYPQLFSPTDGFTAGPTGNSLGGMNALAFALELPIDVLTNGGANPILGGWTTACVPQTRVLNAAPTHPGDVVVPPGPTDPYVQVSRLGMPLLNMILIGLSQKDQFNAESPVNDLVFFASYLLNPTYAEQIGAPSASRVDVLEYYLKGLAGVNQTPGAGDMLRLNTTVSPTPPALQDPLGTLATPPDPAGHPNGRRPGDDVVDIALRVLAGELLGLSGPFPTDGVSPDPTSFSDTFPYLQDPAGADRKRLILELTSSTETAASTFAAVDGACVDPQRPDHIVTDMPPEELVFFKLSTDTAENPARIDAMMREGDRLAFLVALAGS